MIFQENYQQGQKTSTNVDLKKKYQNRNFYNTSKKIENRTKQKQLTGQGNARSVKYSYGDHGLGKIYRKKQLQKKELKNLKNKKIQKLGESPCNIVSLFVRKSVSP